MGIEPDAIIEGREQLEMAQDSLAAAIRKLGAETGSMMDEAQLDAGLQETMEQKLKVVAVHIAARTKLLQLLREVALIQGEDQLPDDDQRARGQEHLTDIATSLLRDWKRPRVLLVWGPCQSWASPTLVISPSTSPTRQDRSAPKSTTA